MWGACPTVFDPVASPGRPARSVHVGSCLIAWAAIRRAGIAARDPHGAEMLKLWTQHAPNLEGAVISSFTRSPLDVERELPNMREGDLLVGAFTNDQVGFNRPFPGAGQYRTHIPQLYLWVRAATRAAMSPACRATTPRR